MYFVLENVLILQKIINNIKDKKMRVIALLLFISLSMNVFAQEIRKNPITPTDFAVEYRATNKRISIVNQTVQITEQNPKFDNPVSAIPSSTNPTTKTIKLTDSQFNDLKQLVESSGFMDLKEREYGAPKTERGYPYVLKIQHNSKQKAVIYKSHPNYPSCPEAFSKIEKYLNLLK